MRRNSAVRDKDRATIARSKPPCALCGGAIDYALKYPDPWSFVVDHKIAMNQGGQDTLDNKQAAHNACNRAKSDRTDVGPIIFRSGFFD